MSLSPRNDILQQAVGTNATEQGTWLLGQNEGGNVVRFTPGQIAVAGLEAIPLGGSLVVSGGTLQDANTAPSAGFVVSNGSTLQTGTAGAGLSFSSGTLSLSGTIVGSGLLTGNTLTAASGTLALPAPSAGMVYSSGSAIAAATIGTGLVYSGGTLSLSGIGLSALPSSVQSVSVPFSYEGAPVAGQTRVVNLAQASVIPANFSGTVGWFNTVATSSSAFVLRVRASGTIVTHGTLTINSGGTVTASVQAARTLAAGDALMFDPPSPADATLADGGFTLLLTRA